jgi:hypothetical protein
MQNPFPFLPVETPGGRGHALVALAADEDQVIAY